MNKYNVCVVGIGAVGTEMVRLLEKRNFPMKSLTILARYQRVETIDGKNYPVEVATEEAFKGMDFAFFAGTEGAKGASKVFGFAAVKQGCLVIDNGDDFRMESWVPLVIPEVNPGALKRQSGLIANPNCSTIIALMALAPLYAENKIKRIIASTYQAVSGTGAKAVGELTKQATDWIRKKEICCSVYPHQILFNVIPAVGSFKDDSGESTEEIKMRSEIHKILGDDSIRISNTCVRVPVLNAHSISLNVEFENPISPYEAREILRRAPGVRVVDNVLADQYPMPIDASGIEEVLVGRIRKDQSVENGLALWCSGDNIWKGAALNAIQIAEHLIQQK